MEQIGLLVGPPRSFLVPSSSSKQLAVPAGSKKKLPRVSSALRGGKSSKSRSSGSSISAVPVVAQPDTLGNAVDALEEVYKQEEGGKREESEVYASTSDAGRGIKRLVARTVKSSRSKRLSLRMRIALKRIELERLVSSRKKDGNLVSRPEDIWSEEAEELIMSSYEMKPIDWQRLHYGVLSSDEEIRLAECLKPVKSLQALRSDLTKLLGREPSDDEWAKAANMDFKTLRRKLQLGQAAQNKLVQYNCRLVFYFAKRFMRDAGSFSLEDLCQEGVKGLITATERFNPGRGTRFSTYASYWIRTAIFRAVISTGYALQLPFNIAEKRIGIRKATRELRSQLGRDPTDEEIMERLGVKPDVYWRAVQSNVRVQSLNETVRGTDEQLLDYLPDSSISTDDIIEEIQAILSELKPKEKLVLENRFFGDGEVHSLREVGRRMNLSQEMVRRYENRALETLKQDPQKLSRLRDCLETSTSSY